MDKLWGKPLFEFVKALREQLKKDDARWGSTWIDRPRKGQEERTIKAIQGYFGEYIYNNEPIPWLKVAGNALICWYRENHPEIWKE
jgi:hypothetical protein